jgi:hypothetical protein
MKNILKQVYYIEPAGYIPTRGLPTSVFSMFNAHSLFKDNEKPDVNQGIVFHESYNDIALFENEINSFEDLLKFESMLRFILLKEHISVFEPSLKTSIKSNGNSLETYTRIPKYTKDSANTIFHNAQAFNILLPIEKLIIQDNKVIQTTNERSIYMGINQSEISDKLLKDQLSKDFLKSLPQSLSIPFIYNQSSNEKNHSKVFSDFLKSLDESFKSETKYTVSHGYDIPLPFFTNAIFSIAKNRDDIPNAIKELRGILEPLRVKLFNYEYEIKGISSTREISLLQRDIKEAINSYTKKIYDPGNMFSDMVRMFISIKKNPNEIIGKMFNPKYSISNDFPILFGDSNYKRMRKIISMDNISTNIEHFLTPQEIQRMKNQ